MGMFDYVICEHAIEGIENPAAIEWQTKDFDAPFMDRYKITEDGRLLEEVVRFEDRSDKSAPAGSFASVAGIMTRVHEGWKDLDYHGDLHFCGIIGHDFIDVKARFTHGALESIQRLPDRFAELRVRSLTTERADA